MLLTFLLRAVADKRGLSFYADATLAAMLRMILPVLISARDELLARDLIAQEMHFTQVLSRAPVGWRRRYEPGQGLIQLGEILHRAGTLPDANQDWSQP